MQVGFVGFVSVSTFLRNSVFSHTFKLHLVKEQRRTMASSKFKIALVQLAVSANKSENLLRASKLVSEASSNGAQIVALPECFNSPYGINYFPEYAESVPDGESCKALSKWAEENKVYLIGGSIPEKGEDDKLYNTCTIWGPSGNLLGKHRKIHLFDIDIPGKMTFQESKVLTSGNDLTTFETEYCKIGVGICYDIRFAEMAQIYRQNGCDLLIYPGAFNMTTGPVHWKTLQQGRALDNQVYVATVSPARDESASYVAWGHSMVVSPWGEVLAEADAVETIVYSDIVMSNLLAIRKQIPIGVQRRTDLYEVVDKSKK